MYSVIFYDLEVMPLVEIIVDEGNLHIKTEYSPDVVKFMRSRPVRHWDTIKREWTLPESDLEIALELFVNLGFEYNLTYMKPEIVNNIPDWYEFKTKPFEHQKEAVSFGLKHPKFLLADEPGCGKTKSVLDLAEILKKEGNVKHVLIVPCVNGLKYNWYNEVLTHTNEKPYILGTRFTKKGREYIGSNEERLRDVESIGNNPEIDECFYIITNIETLRFNKIVEVPLKTKKNGVQRFKKQTLYPIVEALQKKLKDGLISMIVCDESHIISNPQSKISQSLLALDAPYKVALTGTPIMNKPTDAYTPLHWLGYEQHSYFAFEQHYCIKGGFGGHAIVGYKNLPDLQAMLDKCMLRRLKSDILDLPEKIYINDYVEMSAQQYKLYDDVLNSIINDIDKIKLSPNPLTMLIRLRQVTGNPQILSSKIKGNPKFDRMLELIEEVVANDGKCIIFSNWTNVINPAFELVKSKGYNPALYTGENKDDREKEKQRFLTDDSCKVMLGTIDAMGTGITLTVANTAIFLDEPWNRAKKDQCEDRIHRIGTKQNPNIITLLCKGTIDERINNIVYRKGKLSDIIVDREEDILRNPKLLNYLLSIN